MRSKKFISLLLLSLVSLIPVAVGCRRVDSTVYSRYERIPEEGWDPAEYITFMPYPADSLLNPSDRFNVYLHVRYNTSKASGPLKMILLTEDDEGLSRSDTLSIPLFSPSGRPLGKGSRLLYETTLPVAHDIPITPGLLVTMKSISPAARSAGILNVGLSLSLVAKDTIVNDTPKYSD